MRPPSFDGMTMDPPLDRPDQRRRAATFAEGTARRDPPVADGAVRRLHKQAVPVELRPRAAFEPADRGDAPRAEPPAPRRAIERPERAAHHPRSGYQLVGAGPHVVFEPIEPDPVAEPVGPVNDNLFGRVAAPDATGVAFARGSERHLGRASTMRGDAPGSERDIAAPASAESWATPSWARTAAQPPPPARPARGTPPPPAMPLRDAMPRPARRFGERLGVRFVQLSVVAIAATVTVAGVRMWRDAKQAPPVIPSAVAVIGDGERLELSPDRQTIVRIAHGQPRWIARQPRPLDELALGGPLVLGRAGDALSAIDAETGRPRFGWTLPAGERWAVQRPVAFEHCFLAMTIRNGNALVHCLDPAAGAARWTATITGGRECAGALQAIDGAYLVQCQGWTTVIDDRDGSTSFDAGGLGLAQRDPPLLLRGGPHPALAPWVPATHRFARRGTALRGTLDATASSIVVRDSKLVLRAPSASDHLATLATTRGDKPPITIGEPELQPVDDAALVADCGGDGSPRFQLLELAPRVGPTFDPAAAQRRVLALLDVDAGRIAWTSRPIVPPRRAGAAAAPICRAGHYFVPVGDGALWVLDAETGTTTAAFAFDADVGASFAELAADQIDGERIAGTDRNGVFELHWKQPIDVRGVHDARGELERVLGHLP